MREEPAKREGEGRKRRLLLAGLVVLALVAMATRPAGAQQTTVLPGAAAEPTLLPGGLQILATPYLWLAGIHGTIETPLPQASSVNVDVSSIDLLSHLTAVPFMGSLEIRDGPLGLLGDALHVPVSTSVTTHNVFVNGGTADLIVNAGTAMLLYRALDTPGQYGDLGVGFRAWSFTANLTLNSGILPAASVMRAAQWGDPLLGGRYHVDLPAGTLPPGFGLSAYGDVGGFGVSAHSDWQLIGTVDYAPAPWVNIQLGYRSLNVDYTASRTATGFNIHLRGPIIAATFKF